MLRMRDKDWKARAALKGVSRAMDPYPEVRISCLSAGKKDTVSEGFSSIGRRFNKILLKEATEALGADRVRMIVQNSIADKRPDSVFSGIPSEMNKGSASSSDVRNLGKQVNVDQGRSEEGTPGRQRASESA
ncbi:MAG: hypothetical protein INF48_01845 [Rhodobacter sp.]|nr:hypothetical protein [Rhodobacter sp.]